MLNQNTEATTNELDVMKGECSGKRVWFSFFVEGFFFLVFFLFQGLFFFALPEKFIWCFSPHSRILPVVQRLYSLELPAKPLRLLCYG